MYYAYIPEEFLAKHFPRPYLQWKMIRSKYDIIDDFTLVDLLEFELSPIKIKSLKNYPEIIEELKNNELFEIYDYLQYSFLERFNLSLQLLNDKCRTINIAFIPKNLRLDSLREQLILEREIKDKYAKNYLWLARVEKEEDADDLPFIILNEDY